MALRPTLQVRRFFCPCNEPCKFCLNFACPGPIRGNLSGVHSIGDDQQLAEDFDQPAAPGRAGRKRLPSVHTGRVPRLGTETCVSKDICSV
jgi:hypothetical protein